MRLQLPIRDVRQVPAKTDPRVPGGIYSKRDVDVAGLRRQLERTVAGEVRFDPGSLAMYANDASNFRQVPIGVVIPRTLDDIVATHRACAKFGAPILNRGGGTSLSGETVNEAVVIDNSKYLTAIGPTDVANKLVTCEPGAINEDVNVSTGKDGLVFGPDPSSHSRCTIGGNIGNNSCGVHSVQAQLYGPGPRTSDNVEALEIVTYEGDRFWVGVNEEHQLDEIIAAGGRKGEIYAQLRDLRDRYLEDIRTGFPSVDKLPRRVSGYNLDELLPEKGFNVARALVGTESTCATVLQATLKLTPGLYQRTLVAIAYPSTGDAGDVAEQIVQQWRPIGLEAVDRLLIEDEQLSGKNLSDLDELPWRDEAGCWLLVQFGADTAEESEARAAEFAAWLGGDGGVPPERFVIMKSEQEGGNSQDLWTIREGGLGSTAFPPDGTDHWPGWEDSAVPPSTLGPYVRDLQQLYERHNLRGAMYGHFGQGCIHSRIGFDLRSAEGLANYRSFMEEAADLVTSYGGTLSGEHGDGQQRAELLDRQYGPRLMEAMREFKRIWDPTWSMSPGKVVDPFKLDENLKLGTNYNPPRPPVKFAYKEDGGDFTHAALRCVGVGKCRVPHAEQTMCPSYQVTREEKHSTRGRARLLFEMLQGDVITDGWQSKEVYDALDLCLACKGCSNDCPVNVDMPTYKSEFLYHHYDSVRRWRPRYAYAFGFIDQWSRLASLVPELANFATQTPVLSRIAKFVAGIDQNRPLPEFAPLTLQQWFRERGGTKNPTGRPVVLFPDTFNNHLHTDVGVACVEAIEAAGWQVIMPTGHVCCGRPLYDYGFLDQAERYLHRVLDQLREHVRAGTPIVGMEPSCLAVFKDELPKILPHDNDASRLAANSYHFGEFFTEFGIEPPKLDGKAVLWGHCHHRATGGIDTEQQVLEGMGLQTESVSGGCCGLAGSWGFEEGKWDISLDCGEQAYLPAVRGADPDAYVVANGFSCQTQLQHAPDTDRRALHLGQVMQLAREGTSAPQMSRPETRAHGKPPAGAVRRGVRLTAAGAVLAGTLAAGAATVRAALRSRR
ncbi:MAG TPA: FAD-binding and (Fe-S)-binding domain-containing protein [Jatrophihabitantaceae bacterium]|nr:FAD-binding and (Fe-S)-binding domain-containing protein [Jatrophihabitantaceae bacterium]